MFLPALLWTMLTGCMQQDFLIEKVNNPPFKPNVEFQGYEDLNNPGFQHLKEKYQLDTIFHGETDEFKRILLLRHWIRSVTSARFPKGATTSVTHAREQRVTRQ